MFLKATGCFVVRGPSFMVSQDLEKPTCMYTEFGDIYIIYDKLLWRVLVKVTEGCCRKTYGAQQNNDESSGSLSSQLYPTNEYPQPAQYR